MDIPTFDPLSPRPAVMRTPRSAEWIRRHFTCCDQVKLDEWPRNTSCPRHGVRLLSKDSPVAYKTWDTDGVPPKEVSLAHLPLAWQSLLPLKEIEAFIGENARGAKPSIAVGPKAVHVSLRTRFSLSQFWLLERHGFEEMTRWIALEEVPGRGQAEPVLRGSPRRVVALVPGHPDIPYWPEDQMSVRPEGTYLMTRAPSAGEDQLCGLLVHNEADRRKIHTLSTDWSGWSEVFYAERERNRVAESDGGALLRLRDLPTGHAAQAGEIRKLVREGKIAHAAVEGLVAHGVDQGAVDYYKNYHTEEEKERLAAEIQRVAKERLAVLEGFTKPAGVEPPFVDAYVRRRTPKGPPPVNEGAGFPTGKINSLHTNLAPWVDRRLRILGPK